MSQLEWWDEYPDFPQKWMLPPFTWHGIDFGFNIADRPYVHGDWINKEKVAMSINYLDSLKAQEEAARYRLKTAQSARDNAESKIAMWTDDRNLRNHEIMRVAREVDTLTAAVKAEEAKQAAPKFKPGQRVIGNWTVANKGAITTPEHYNLANKQTPSDSMSFENIARSCKPARVVAALMETGGVTALFERDLIAG